MHRPGPLTRLQEGLIAALRADRVVETSLSAADRALVAYADKLTLTPAAISAADIVELRTAGFDDRAIHDACAGYFAFVNRIADGLGVELEASWPRIETEQLCPAEAV